MPKLKNNQTNLLQTQFFFNKKSIYRSHMETIERFLHIFVPELLLLASHAIRSIKQTQWT